LSTVLGYLVLKGDLFVVKGALIRALVSIVLCNSKKK
jgi:hypothetical protein